jgi:hypothetical protein
MSALPKPIPIDDPLLVEAEFVRSAGVLGKPGALSRLFDFLVARSAAGDAPKELELAVHVFGKDPTFDVAQDSVVRVYVHKLRRRLEDLYEKSERPSRLRLPKGEYRLTLDQPPANEVEILPLPAPPPKKSARGLRWWWVALGLVCAFALGIGITLLAVRQRPSAELEAVRSSPIWAPLLADDEPITIVIGDYYLVGETDASGTIKRLVRDFFINSPGDLLHQAETSPDSVKNYRNLDLTYLPTGAAYALRNIVPVLTSKKRVRIMLMSELNGMQLKGSHIVYIGYISGLGMLGDSVFAGSRLSPGGSYDELIDSSTNQKYVSTANSSDEVRYTDYGYFSTFPGPDHNRIVVIAGTRDTGVTQIAEALTTSSTLRDIDQRASGAPAFESLYEVYGVARASTSAKLLFVSRLKTAHLWD